MGQTFSGGIGIATGFKLQDPQPIEDRMSVDTFTDLASLPNKYDGLITYVKDEKTHYKYNGVSWVKLSSGGVVSVTGSLVDNTDPLNPIVTFNDDNLLAEKLTHSEIRALISTSGLKTGKFYLMTDFETIYDQPDYLAEGVVKDIVQTKTGGVNPILLLATSLNTVAREVWMPSRRKWKFEYDIDFIETEYMKASAKGRITWAKDENGNEAPYDHFVVVLKRYESASIPGQYNSYWDTGNPSQEFKTFVGYCHNNKIEKTEQSIVFPNATFLINNNVIYTESRDNIFKKNNINNTLGAFSSNNVFGYNSIGNVFGDGTVNNTFKDNSRHCVFKDGLINNLFEADMADVDFYSATHLYSGYNCRIFKRQDSTLRLSYTNNTDNIVVVDPTT